MIDAKALRELLAKAQPGAYTLHTGDDDAYDAYDAYEEAKDAALAALPALLDRIKALEDCIKMVRAVAVDQAHMHVVNQDPREVMARIEGIINECNRAPLKGTP